MAAGTDTFGYIVVAIYVLFEIAVTVVYSTKLVDRNPAPYKDKSIVVGISAEWLSEQRPTRTRLCSFCRLHKSSCAALPCKTVHK